MIAAAEPAKCASKLRLCLECHRAGWTGSHLALAPYKPTDPLQFEWKMVTKSSWYFKALLSAAQIFDKGSCHIMHGMPEGYYKVTMKVKDLHGFHERPDFLTLRNQDFEAIASGKKPVAQLVVPLALPPADAPLAVEEGMADEGDMEDAALDLLGDDDYVEPDEGIGRWTTCSFCLFS